MTSLLKARVEENLASMPLDTDSSYAVAFSGGPDSAFLLDCLSTIGFSDVTAIYVNYHDSPRVHIEEQIVKDTCDRLGYALHSYDANITAQVIRNNLNFEDAARTVRYNIFAKESKENEFDCIFVAHQEDDLIETYLMQKDRNKLVNFWGIAPVSFVQNVRIVRPLLNITKEEIIRYLNFNEIPYYDDLTNKNLARTRNNIRHNQLPSIDRVKIIKEINKKNEVLQAQLDKLDKLSTPLVKYIKYNKLSVEEQLRFLFQRVTEFSTDGTSNKILISSRNLAFEYLKKTNATGCLKLNEDLYLYRNYDNFYFRKKVKTAQYNIMVHTPSMVQSINFKLDLTKFEMFNLKSSDFPVTIRPYKQDDVFGTKIKNSSVKNFIRNNKVPQYLREIYPVIINKHGKIVCVPFFKDIKDKKVPLKFKSFKLN